MKRISATSQYISGDQRISTQRISATSQYISATDQRISTQRISATDQRIYTGDLKHLNNSEIRELYSMYDSGKYYMHEMYEWFGISYYMCKKYLKERSSIKNHLKQHNSVNKRRKKLK